MNVRLVIESTPHAQSVTEHVFTGGRLVIGRSDDADWVLNDPDMYVSRQHCILTEQGGQVMVTDASSSGLFIDNAANPVGTSKAVAIEPGMRLRMGDFVLRVEALTGGASEPARRAADPGGMVFDFSRREDEPPPPEPGPRPKDLPDPFGLSSSARSHERQRPARRPRNRWIKRMPLALICARPSMDRRRRRHLRPSRAGIRVGILTAPPLRQLPRPSLRRAPWPSRSRQRPPQSPISSPIGAIPPPTGPSPRRPRRLCPRRLGPNLRNPNRQRPRHPNPNPLPCARRSNRPRHRSHSLPRRARPLMAMPMTRCCAAWGWTPRNSAAIRSRRPSRSGGPCGFWSRG